MSNKSNVHIPLRVGLIQVIAYIDGYDYSSMFHFIKEFRNPFPNRPFITEMADNYGMLWQFKGCVERWALGISCTKGYAYIFHKEANSPTFLPLNVLEKVILVEQFHNKFIVIGIQVMDSAGVDIQHVHFIVVKLGEGSVHFDINGMLENLNSIG